MYVDRSINKDDYNLFSCLSRSKLSIYGYMEYAKDNRLLTPYPASSLVIITSGPGQDEEAGPLPSKVNLDQSNV
ncbi:unnamed protein product [Coregonus sp. 'balchen']|nr:unnamed protein product [Coregonus sp. 'balchen']